MTSKEALEILVSKTNLLNNTCSSLNNCIKSKRCVLNTPCKNCDDYKLVMTIKQDLVRSERLEMLEKDLKTTNEFNKKLREENSKYKKAIEILKGRICVHNQYICYDAHADIRLKDNEIKLLEEVL